MKALKVVSEILNSKLFLYIFIAVGAFVFFQIRGCDKKESEAIQTYNRQLQGQLSSEEKKLQESHHEMGLLKAKLLTHEELNKSLEEDNEKKDKEFEKFKKDHNLAIKSRDKSIAQLKQQIKNGITITTIDPSCNIDNLQNCVISYQWKDPYNRFHLIDSNIFEEDNEIFESSQLFKVYGEIYQQKDSSLQIRRLVLREVYKNESGEYKDIEGAKADIIDSEFQYSNVPFSEEWKWQNLFRMRVIAIGGIEMLPNAGNMTFGLGIEFFTFHGFGGGSYTLLDFQNPKLISQHISLQYNPTIMDTELNLGVFMSIGTPFVNLFNDYQFGTGLIFYLNN